MFPSLSLEQRRVAKASGTPLAIKDSETGLGYVLFAVRMAELDDGSVSAAIPALQLYGEGDSPDDALMSLVEGARLLSGR